ncbi:phospholemman-like isoform X2 [Anarrhichthys ocellatus]|uniref:phospholemman-like isoform X2 n=1 Tax=Anarrhichthys ocellatus TaxID=433405 RepID=UPI0012ED6096|nr:phospholemman-like isoform X2 [Anarrhichthys ocellatus]
MQCFAVATRGSLLSLQRGFLSSSACCPVQLPRFISNLKLHPAKFLGDGDPLHLYSAAMATKETMFPDRSDFDYDYETLRTTGVVLAAIMFVSGILIALSKKFTNCVKSSSNSSSSGTQIPKTEVPPQTV